MGVPLAQDISGVNVLQNNTRKQTNTYHYDSIKVGLTK